MLGLLMPNCLLVTLHCESALYLSLLLLFYVGIDGSVGIGFGTSNAGSL